MKSIAAIVGLGVLLCSAAGVQAKPAYVVSTVNLRAAPNTTSEIVGKIPSGSLVDADACSDGWCAVTWQEKRGFAIQTSLDLSGRVPARRAARPAPRGAEVVEEGPPVYYDGGPPPAYYYYYGGPYYYRPYYGHGYYGYRRGYRW